MAEALRLTNAKITNAGAKVLLFCEICKYFCVFEEKIVILSAEVNDINKN
ncbi:MAG: hypothetical protein J6A35_00060 [Paludibacteraceae bacterium]|nr:hypothetical protein [Paludibacteraceae bacterium]